MESKSRLPGLWILLFFSVWPDCIFCCLWDRWYKDIEKVGWWVMGEEMEKRMQNHSEERAPTFSAEDLFIKRIGSCPYHKCLTGRGVCFMATRAPPQSRNQTLYSSSKIWNNNKNSNHSNASHLQCLTVCSLSYAWYCLDSSISRGSCRQLTSIIWIY